MTEPLVVKKQKRWGWIPGVLVSVVAIILIIQVVGDWDTLKQSFSSFNGRYIFASAAFCLLFLLIRGQAWRTILGSEVGLWQSFLVVNQGYLINSIIFNRAGEIARSVLMSKHVKKNPFYVLSTIIIERAFDLVIAAGLLLSTLPLALGMDWARPVATVIIILVIAGLVVLFLVARNHETVELWAEKFLSRWKFTRKIVLPQIKPILAGLGTLTRPVQFILSFFWIFLSWCAAIGMYYVLILAIQPDAPVWWGIFADSVLAVGIALPSAPAALGVFEGSLVAALTLLGVDASMALAYAVIVHFVQFIVTAVIGFYALIKDGRSIGELLNNFHQNPEQH